MTLFCLQTVENFADQADQVRLTREFCQSSCVTSIFPACTNLDSFTAEFVHHFMQGKEVINETDFLCYKLAYEMSCMLVIVIIACIQKYCCNDCKVALYTDIKSTCRVCTAEWSCFYLLSGCTCVICHPCWSGNVVLLNNYCSAIIALQHLD